MSEEREREREERDKNEMYIYMKCLIEQRAEIKKYRLACLKLLFLTRGVGVGTVAQAKSIRCPF